MDDYIKEENVAKNYFATHRGIALRIQNNMEEEISNIIDKSKLSRDQRDGKLHFLEEYKLRHTVCKEAFEQVIEMHSEIRGLLAEISNEYENFLNALFQGETQYNFIYEQLKKVTTDPITLTLLRKRADELEKKIEILNESNRNLANQIAKISKSGQINLMDSRASISGANNLREVSVEDGRLSKHELSKQRKQMNSSVIGEQRQVEKRKILSAISLSGATDVQALLSYSSKIQSRINKLTNSLKTDYAPRKKQVELTEQFCKKENSQHHLLKYNAKLKERFENLKFSIESLKNARAQSKSGPVSMFSAVTKALDSYRETTTEHGSVHSYDANDGIFEDDDPTQKRNEERLMDYIDTFNEMIGDKQYEHAAKHAANSPKAILRTYEIMKLFKEIEDTATTTSPQMLFCHALMATADKATPMSAALSCEVIKCALANQRLDLASHWLSKDCFKLSLPMANALLHACTCERTCTCRCMNLAKEIFDKLGAHRQASLCLLSTGKIHQMIQYGEDHNFTVHDYTYLCKRYPSTKLLLFLVSAHPEVNIQGLISFPFVVSMLLDTEDIGVLLELLTEIHEKGIVSVDGSRKSLTQLVFAETSNDEMSTAKWQQVIDICAEKDLGEIAEELLAAIMVREALDNAAYRCVLDYIS
eukprot:gene11181-12355_t